MATVGSECDILDSTALATTANVTMAWRDRSAAENGSRASSSGIQWLTSNVVDVEGVPSGTVFAMEISFDDGINTALEHPATPTTIQDSYLAKLVTTGSVSVWENAALTLTSGSLAQTAVADTLSDFLADEYAAHPSVAHDVVLAELAGSWGVNLNRGGVGSSWAIVNSDGQYAVVSVPEPSTVMLLAAGAICLLANQTRRRRKKA